MNQSFFEAFRFNVDVNYHHSKPSQAFSKLFPSFFQEFQKLTKVVSNQRFLKLHQSFRSQNCIVFNLNLFKLFPSFLCLLKVIFDHISIKLLLCIKRQKTSLRLNIKNYIKFNNLYSLQCSPTTT